jgi:mannose-6-phosphate isomerase-like protein (cupin superfamily)
MVLSPIVSAGLSRRAGVRPRCQFDASSLRSNVGIFVWSDLALSVNVCAEPDNLISVQKSHNRDDFQDVPGYVAAMANAFPRDSHNTKHSHKRAQLIFAISGVMEIGTSGHHWLIPPQRALWAPPQVEHEMRARTDVELRTIYVRTADLPASLPSIPTLLYMTPLPRELIIRAVELPIEDGVSGSAAHIVALILSELQFVPPGEFHTPRVTDSRLVKIEEKFKQDQATPAGSMNGQRRTHRSLANPSLLTRRGPELASSRDKSRILCGQDELGLHRYFTFQSTDRARAGSKHRSIHLLLRDLRMNNSPSAIRGVISASSYFSRRSR